MPATVFLCPCCGRKMEYTAMLCTQCSSYYICNKCGEKFCSTHQILKMKKHRCGSFTLEGPDDPVNAADREILSKVAEKIDEDIRGEGGA